MYLLFQGLLRGRSRLPESVVNIENRKQRMESLECRNALAKQVLSQLSYTPSENAEQLCGNDLILQLLTAFCIVYRPEFCVQNVNYDAKRSTISR